MSVPIQNIVEVGTAITNEIAQIETRLLALVDQAKSINFYHAAERLEQAHDLARGTRRGLTHHVNIMQGKKR